MIAGASHTLDVAITLLNNMQLLAHMHASNSSNQCSQVAALCIQAEQWEQAMYTEDLVI